MNNRLSQFFSSSGPVLCRCLLRRFKSSNARAADKSSPRRKKKTAARPKQSSSNPLYQAISDIVGPVVSPKADAPTEYLKIADAGFAQRGSSFSRRPGVCQIAGESTSYTNGGGTAPGECLQEEKQYRYPCLEDTGTIVQQIMGIVRSETSWVRMEKRLEELSVSWSSDVVEKVLKECLKLGDFALQFFNWVKLQPGFCHNTETYNEMIYIALEAKDFNLVKKLVDEMDEELCPKNLKTWTALISHYGKAKQIGKALRAFEAMKKSGCEGDLKIYEAILFTLCNSNQADLALEFYKEMTSKNMVVKKKFYEMLMDCLASSGDVASVRLVGVDMMKTLQVPESEVYMCILRSFCDSGKIEEAKQLFEDIKNKSLVVDSDVCETLVKGLCRVGMMDQTMDDVKGVEPNSPANGRLYDCLIDCFLKKGDITKPLELLGDMRKFDCQSMLSTYTEMIQELFRSGDYQTACTLYEEMLRNGIEPDSATITDMVAGHVQHYQISKAWEVFETMKMNGRKPTSEAYSVFVSELCQVCKPLEAVKLLEEMSSSRVNASDALFNLVIASLNKIGELEKARKVKQICRLYKLDYQEHELSLQSSDHQCVDHGHEISNYSPESVASSEATIVDDADLKEVRRIICSSTDWSTIQEDLERCTINFTPQLVGAILCSCQRYSRAALQFFSWIGGKPGYVHTAETYNTAIKVMGSAKDFKQMRYLFREMNRRNLEITSNTWTIMLCQYGQAGLTKMALDVFQEMKNSGYQPNGSTYKCLIVYLCAKKGRKINEAVKLFREMIKVGYMPDKEMLDIYLSSLCESKQLVNAKKSMKSLISRGFNEQAGYNSLVKSLCRAGRVDEALKAAHEMELHGCTRDQYTYGSIVHALLRAGRFEDALDKIEAMKEAGIPQSAHIYTSLIIHFCSEENIARAVEIFTKMKDDGCEPTVVTFSALIRGFMNMGMVSDARNIFRRMQLKGPFPDFETYSMFMSCLCKSGKSEEALQLLHEMLDNGIIPSSINFQRVFHGLNREGKQDLARVVLQTKWRLKRERMYSLVLQQNPETKVSRLCTSSEILHFSCGMDGGRMIVCLD
ncbi:putative pentatricopeptide repeat-containing protein At5g06400, mitochondrial [Zingiber officinale]|uniref:putative pentatricopeptide repeat-containing protein At5g06400, mitochondrial n=1 Tax=Zingiber officinale TaxID=94328 RepID=UPI001C4A8412|nr:putative pentatricopeptide repeat-containing protein At5g06400, mitochondrial [Zingiber officinale]